MEEQALTLKDRKELEVCGVKNIISFDEETVVLDTVLGDLSIVGEGLHITTLTLNDNRVALQGNKINALEYRESVSGQMKVHGQNLLRRILK